MYTKQKSSRGNAKRKTWRLGNQKEDGTDAYENFVHAKKTRKEKEEEIALSRMKEMEENIEAMGREIAKVQK